MLLGVEHEFRVLDADRLVVAAGPLLAARGPEFGARLDPSDVNAVRLASGAVVTVDGDEAEMASPLIRYDESMELALAAATHAGTTTLAAIAQPASLEGYSTHLSVSTGVTRAAGARQIELTSQLLRDVAGPILAVLAEPQHGAGVLVRPRRARVEVCSEHVTGDDLTALACYLGAALVAVESSELRASITALRLRTEYVPSVHRYGWFLDPSTSLGHWYQLGRKALVQKASGEMVTIEDHLAATWALIRPIAAASLTQDLCRIVDARVDGSAPLRCERLEASPPLTPDFEFRNVLGPHRFGDVTLECLATTWTATVFAATDDRGTTLLTVPTTVLVGFLDDCASTPMLADLMRSRRRFRASVDERRPRRQSRVDPSSMVARERRPDGSLPPRVPGSRRSAKDRADQHPRRLRSARRSRGWRVAVGVAVTAAAISGAVLKAQGDDSTVGPDAPSNAGGFQASGSTALDQASAVSNDIATFDATGGFTSFTTGLSQLSEQAREMFVPAEASRGLWPPPEGEAVDLSVTLRGVCDGEQPCVADLIPYGLAAGNAIFKFSFLIDSFPQLTFELEPTGTGYRYHRDMRWSEAAAKAGFDECASGDPLNTLDIELSLQGDELVGRIAAAVEPLAISGPGGCWGIAFVIDFSARAA